jgi:hypothetical protein
MDNVQRYIGYSYVYEGKRLSAYRYYVLMETKRKTNLEYLLLD